MEKGRVLTHILQTKSTSSLLGGDPLGAVINSSNYISVWTSEDKGRDENVEYVPLDEAIHNTMSADGKNVTLVGPEGSGKTTALEKLVLDWARGERLQSFSYLLHVSVKELNCLQETLSLETLMLRDSRVPPESSSAVLQDPSRVLLVLDDLHACRQSLDPSAHALCVDPGRAVSPGCLVASLLHGSLLNGASCVASSRGTAELEFLPGPRMELLGFLKPQVEAYFHSFFTDPAAANEAFAHLEKTLGFYDFGTSPRFCWTVCSLYKSLMDTGGDLPGTVSQLCVAAVVHLIQGLQLATACSRELVQALGKMASHCFLSQHPGCSGDETVSFGLEKFPDAVAVFLQVDGGPLDGRVFSFPSQLMQEFLLAVSYFWDESASGGVEGILERHKGRAKLIDAFLSALSEPLQRRPLETVLGEPNADRVAEFKRWLKSSSEEWLRGYKKDQHHRCFRLLHQAQNQSLVKEVFTPTARVGLGYSGLGLPECVALNYVVECLGEIEMMNFYGATNLTVEHMEFLAPAMSLSHTINLNSSKLCPRSAALLASALSRGITTELDLSQVPLGDGKFRILCDGLRDCKLRTLRLQVCGLKELNCDDLASVLSSSTSQLQLLPMRHNKIGDLGFAKLCKGLRSPHCTLQEIHLQGCKLTAASMEVLSEVLTSGQSDLKKVDLTLNAVGPPGVAALCKALRHPGCKLQGLILYTSELTGECCSHLREALMLEHCRLSELDLSVNELGQEGTLLLCQALSRPGCPMEKLGLVRCELTEPVFQELGSLLRSGSSRLKSLSVGVNNVGDRGVKHLWEAVAHPNCLLEELDVEMTGLTDECMEDLLAALRATKTLRTLEMKNNTLTDDSAAGLVQAAKQCQSMQEMNIQYNDFSEDVLELFDTCEKIRY